MDDKQANEQDNSILLDASIFSAVRDGGFKSLDEIRAHFHKSGHAPEAIEASIKRLAKRLT